MYICPKHGVLDSRWCEECEKEYPCDCSNMTTTRFKDLSYDCEEGPRNVTLYLQHCNTCGNILCVEL